MENLKISPKFNSFKDAARHVNGLKLKSREAIFVLARHGETFYNKARSLPSSRNLATLTDKGQNDAHLMKKSLDLLPISFKASADSPGAVQTMKLAYPNDGCLILMSLVEFDFGVFGGMTFEGAESEFAEKDLVRYYTFNNNTRDFRAPRGEIYREFEHRVRTGFLEDILPRNMGGTSFLVSHLYPIREILFDTVLNSNINIMKPAIEGTSITILHFSKDTSPTLLLFNNTEHLAER